MEATEFRIGNLLELPNKQKVQISIDSLKEIETGIHPYQEIPLTEGRLRKFDLSNFMFTVFGDNNRGFHIAIDGDHWIFIKYVHTFQNLYFALIGEELIINET